MINTIAVLLLLFCWIPVASGCTKKDAGHSPNIVRLGTFNIAWLGDGVDDKITRTEDDFKRIASVIEQTDADVLGLEEIKNSDALRRVLKYIPEYDYYVGTHGHSQNLGVLFRKNVFLKVEQEYMPVAVDTARNRPGLVLSCRKGNFDWKMMVVHLKSSSRYDSTIEMQTAARTTRTVQVEKCARWVDSTLKTSKEQDLFIIGDFNDFPKRVKNPTLTALLVNTSIEFLTYESKSCKNDKWFGIDHILCSKSAKKRYITGSDHAVNFYAQYTEIEAEKISDHCPMIVDFDVSAPDND